MIREQDKDQSPTTRRLGSELILILFDLIKTVKDMKLEATPAS